MHHDEPYCSRATVIDREPTVDKKNHAASAPYDGWRPTTVDVPVASGDGSTPQPAPTPFIMGAVLAQAIGAAQGRVRPVGACSPPNGRREADLDFAGDGFAPTL